MRENGKCKPPAAGEEGRNADGGRKTLRSEPSGTQHVSTVCNLVIICFRRCFLYVGESCEVSSVLQGVPNGNIFSVQTESFVSLGTIKECVAVKLDLLSFLS